MIATEDKEQVASNIGRLLRPRSIALVGASATPGSLGESVLLNLETAPCAGDFYFVNPKKPIIQEKQCFGSIEKLPANIDCAVLAIPGTTVLPSARSCAEKGVRSLIVFSAGFAESGAEGQKAQLARADIARQNNMFVWGPNCLGMVNYIDSIPLTFVVTPPQSQIQRRGAAIISQSGALAAVIGVNMRHHRIPLSYAVSTGNEAYFRLG